MGNREGPIYVASAENSERHATKCMHHAQRSCSDARERTQAEVLPALRRVVTQQALIETRASLAGLTHVDPHAIAPSTVFMGIGMTTATDLSCGLPLDALGMLFSAEQVREAVQAREIRLLLADAHAIENGHDQTLVAEQCGAYERILTSVLRRLGWSHVRLQRARELHALDAYARIHAQVRRAAARHEHAYVTREVADIEYFARQGGGILKVGWALESHQASARDERAFDERFLRWVGPHVGFIYCKAGRALDDHRRKAAPYVVRDPSRRVCLRRDERVHEKLRRAELSVSISTLRGVRRHLRAITRSYKRLGHHAHGSVEDQTQRIITDLLGPELVA